MEGDDEIEDVQERITIAVDRTEDIEAEIEAARGLGIEIPPSVADKLIDRAREGDKGLRSAEKELDDRIDEGLIEAAEAVIEGRIEPFRTELEIIEENRPRPFAVNVLDIANDISERKGVDFDTAMERLEILRREDLIEGTEVIRIKEPIRELL